MEIAQKDSLTLVDMATNILGIQSNGKVNIEKTINLRGEKGRIGIKSGKTFLTCLDKKVLPSKKLKEEDEKLLYMEKYPNYNFLYKKDDESRLWLLYGFSSGDYALVRFTSTTGGKVSVRFVHKSESILKVSDQYHYDNLMLLKREGKVVINEETGNGESKRTVNISFAKNALHVQY